MSASWSGLYIPLKQTPPGQTVPRQTPHHQADTPLPRQTAPRADTPRPPPTVTAAWPTGMHSCLCFTFTWKIVKTDAELNIFQKNLQSIVINIGHFIHKDVKTNYSVNTFRKKERTTGRIQDSLLEETPNLQGAPKYDFAKFSKKRAPGIDPPMERNVAFQHHFLIPGFNGHTQTKTTWQIWHARSFMACVIIFCLDSIIWRKFLKVLANVFNLKVQW